MALEGEAATSSTSDPAIDPAVETANSKERIEKCAPLWYWFQVLGVNRRSSVLDDVKKAYRKLCLLHHPDKSGGDAVTFKAVHKAYSEAQRVCMIRSSKQMLGKKIAKPAAKVRVKKVKVVKVKREKPPPKEKLPPKAPEPPPPPVNPLEETLRVRAEVTAKLFAAAEGPAASGPGPRRGVKRPRPKAVAANVSKAKLQAAINRWDNGSFKNKTMPDEVESMSAEQAAATLKDGSCIPVDVRSDRSSSLPGDVVAMTYFQLLTTPEEVAEEVHRLRDLGKRLLIFSQDGAAMGACGLVGSMFLDIFGFEDDMVFRLEGGYDALKPLLGGNGEENEPSLASALSARKALTEAKRAQKEADLTLAKAKADLIVYDSASRDHLDTLAKGEWATEDVAREHLSQLSPLLKPLKLESSLLAMLTNASCKRPAQRGPFDAMVFTELGTRFAQKIKALQNEVEAAAVWFTEQKGVVKAAQAEVDLTKRAAGSPSPKKDPDSAQKKTAGERIAALRAKAEWAVAEAARHRAAAAKNKEDRTAADAAAADIEARTKVDLAETDAAKTAADHNEEKAAGAAPADEEEDDAEDAD